MQNVILTNKAIGETPLECLERVRVENAISDAIPMTYAGRLDPMAEGLLIILVGDECKERQKYTKLDKEYEVKVLLGVETDSYDILGLIKKVNPRQTNTINLNNFVGKFNQEYPRYSSKIIAMKELPEEMPTKDVEIYSIEEIDSREISGTEIADEAIEKINKVKGDFRQDVIKRDWLNFQNKYAENMFQIKKIKVKCSNGTYMRSLAVQVSGLAWSIKRIKVGNFVI